MTSEQMLALCDEAERLASAATAGPWTREMVEDGEMLPDGTGTFDGYVETNDVEGPPIGEDGYHNPVASCFHGADAAFIARSRTLVPELVSALRDAIASVGLRHWDMNDAHQERDASLTEAEVLRGKLHEAQERAELAVAVADAAVKWADTNNGWHRRHHYSSEEIDLIDAIEAYEATKEGGT